MSKEGFGSTGSRGGGEWGGRQSEYKRILAKHLIEGSKSDFFFFYMFIFKEKKSTLAVNHLSGGKAQHGVWARILEKFRSENLRVNSAKWTLLGVHVIIGLGVLTKKVDALKCWKQKENLMAVLLAHMISSR